MPPIGCKIILLTLLYSFNSINAIQDSGHISFERFWIVSTELFSTPELKRSAKPCDEFHLNLENYTTLDICVYRGDLRECNISSDESKLIIYEEDGSKNETFLNQIDYTTLHGYVIGAKEHSNVDGYLQDGRFLGKIYIDDTILYVEDLLEFAAVGMFDWPYSSCKGKSIVYENGVSSVNCSMEFTTIKKRHLNEVYSTRHTEASTNEIVGFLSKVCTLGVYVDTAYYKYSMGNNELKTRASVIESVKTANSIFRSTDFFNIGQPNNIGIEIKYIIIYKESNNSPLPPFYPFKRDGIWQMKEFVGKVPLLDNKVTLGVLFTGQVMTDNTVGLAFLPIMSSYDYSPFRTMNGICSTAPDGTYFGNNALLVISEGYTKRTTQEQLDLVLTHELGHAFGAVHDGDSRHARCKGYVMSSSTGKWQNGKKHRFSTCSIEDIGFVLADRHFCMDKPAHKPFCGNAVVEPPERCDCGSKYACADANSCCRGYDSADGQPCTYRC